MRNAHPDASCHPRSWADHDHSSRRPAYIRRQSHCGVLGSGQTDTHKTAARAFATGPLQPLAAQRFRTWRARSEHLQDRELANTAADAHFEIVTRHAPD
jgi:hypothetical protein